MSRPVIPRRVQRPSTTTTIKLTAPAIRLAPKYFLLRIIEKLVIGHIPVADPGALGPIQKAVVESTLVMPVPFIEGLEFLLPFPGRFFPLLGQRLKNLGLLELFQNSELLFQVYLPLEECEAVSPFFVLFPQPFTLVVLPFLGNKMELEILQLCRPVVPIVFL